MDTALHLTLALATLAGSIRIARRPYVSRHVVMAVIALVLMFRNYSCPDTNGSTNCPLKEAKRLDAKLKEAKRATNSKIKKNKS
jgi:hypothetical protein